MLGLISNEIIFLAFVDGSNINKAIGILQRFQYFKFI